MSNSLDMAQRPQVRGPERSAALRILMVAPQPFFRPRGTPFSVLHRIRALLVAGHAVDLVTYPIGEDVPALEALGLRTFRCGRPPFIRDVKIGPSIPKIFLDLSLYLATARRLRDHRYDVLHTHEEAAFFGVGLARRYEVKHVYDMHSSLPHQLANFRAYDFGFLRRFFSMQERRVLRTCDGVITICAELRDIAQRELGTRPHAMIENTGDDARVFTGEGRNVRKELGLEGKTLALYTGTFEAYQGLDLLLQAFRRVHGERPQAHLLLVGGRPSQIEATRALAGELGIGDAVTFTGQVHPSRIPAFLDACDLIVSPRSSGTNTPLKIYGYMRSRRPVVATDMPTHTQTLDSGIALLAAPEPGAFAAGMAALIDDPEKGRRLAQAARERADELFSDAAYLTQVAALYEQVAAR